MRKKMRILFLLAAVSALLAGMTVNAEKKTTITLFVPGSEESSSSADESTSADESSSSANESSSSAEVSDDAGKDQNNNESQSITTDEGGNVTGNTENGKALAPETGDMINLGIPAATALCAGVVCLLSRKKNHKEV